MLTAVWRLIFGKKEEKFLGFVTGDSETHNGYYFSTCRQYPVFEVWNTKNPEESYYEVRRDANSVARIDKQVYLTGKKVWFLN